MSPRPASGSSLPRALYALVVASGATGLVFEIIWVRALGLTLGTSSRSVATVVTAFMAGMALGSWGLGRLADRHPRPLRLYAQLELAIGLVGGGVSLVLLRGHDAIVALLDAVHAGTLPYSLQTVVRAALALALLLAPTTLMGGTLPVLTRALARTRAPGQVLGALYAANTAGAVVGALFPDLVALPHLGMLATAGLAALGDVGVAAVAWRLPFRDEGAPPAAPPGPLPAHRRGIALFAVSGFCALGYELIWSRIIEHLVGGFAIGFAVLLAVYLAALALGSAVAGPLLARTSSPLPWAGLALASAALAMVLPIAFIGEWREAVAHHLPGALGTPHAAWIQLGLVRYLALASALVLEGVAALLLGMGLPFIAAATVGPTSTGATTGRLYAANTLAGAAGSLITGFALIPWLGLQAASGLLAAVAAAAAAMAILDRRVGWRLVPTALVAASVIALAVRQPAHNLDRNLLHLTKPPLALVEGATTTAAAVSRLKLGVEAARYLAQPGVEMSDTSQGSRRYMGLMAHLPLLFSGQGPGAREALLICYGVGNTARSLLAHPEVTHLDVVDTASEVLRLSPVFAEVTGSDPLRDARTRVSVEDGRFFLATTARRYDVITAEPPPPTWAGVNNLYSREYYRAARRALRPGGVVAQWLPRFQVTSAQVLAIVAAMTAEFPNVALFDGFTEEWILLGSDHPLEVDLPSWRSQLASPPVGADLRSIGITRVEELAATYMQANDGLRRATADTRPLTDDHPALQYPDEDVKSPWTIPAGLLADPSTLLPLVHLAPGESDERLRHAFEAQHLLLEALTDDDYGAGQQSPQFGKLIASALADEPGRQDALSLLGLADDDVRVARAALQATPGLPEAAFLLARRDFTDGRYAAALQTLQTLQPDRATAAQYWAMRSAVEGALGDTAAAAASYAHLQEASRGP